MLVCVPSILLLCVASLVMCILIKKSTSGMSMEKAFSSLSFHVSVTQQFAYFIIADQPLMVHRIWRKTAVPVLFFCVPALNLFISISKMPLGFLRIQIFIFADYAFYANMTFYIRRLSTDRPNPRLTTLLHIIYSAARRYPTTEAE